MYQKQVPVGCFGFLPQVANEAIPLALYPGSPLLLLSFISVYLRRGRVWYGTTPTWAGDDPKWFHNRNVWQNW